jgi:hypothetical protein
MRRSAMREEMTIDDAVNVFSVVADEDVHDDDRDISARACAAIRLVNYVDDQSLEVERERTRRHGLRRGDTRIADGHRIEGGWDGGGRRDLLAGRGVHAGETLYLLTDAGWHAVRYESNMSRSEPLLYLPFPAFEKTFSSVFHAKRSSRGQTNCGGHD